MLGTEDASDYRSALLPPGGSGPKVNFHQPTSKSCFLPHSHRSRRPTSSSQIAVEPTPTAGCSVQLRPVSRWDYHSQAQLPVYLPRFTKPWLLGGMPHLDLDPWLEAEAMNFMNLAPIPPVAGMQVTKATAESSMLTSRTLATRYIKDHTCPQLRLPSNLGSVTPGPLTRMVSTRLWTWSWSREACVQNRTR